MFTDLSGGGISYLDAIFCAFTSESWKKLFNSGARHKHFTPDFFEELSVCKHS